LALKDSNFGHRKAPHYYRFYCHNKLSSPAANQILPRLRSIITMKTVFFLFLALCASSTSALTRRPQMDALQVRGGANLGPLDSDMAMKLAKTATTAYVAGSASKYIAKQSGGTSPQV
jgi:hypothetical protein